MTRLSRALFSIPMLKNKGYYRSEIRRQVPWKKVGYVLATLTLLGLGSKLGIDAKQAIEAYIVVTQSRSVIADDTAR